MTHAGAPHIPVMLEEMLIALHPRDGETYVDGTFGWGGYTQAILDKADCTVIALDRDPEALARALELQKTYGKRLIFIAGNFSDMQVLLKQHHIGQVHGIVLDIGVSSMQLDSESRGFSFRFDAPLDMRMSQQGTSAKDVLNHESEEELARIIYQYGEESAARKIARAIVKKRAEAPLETTKQLSEIVHSILGPKRKTDPATKTFQAIRIHVNDELGALHRVLDAAEILLRPEGRLVVISFHSLEDRIVKQFFKTKSMVREHLSRHMPDQKNTCRATFELARPSKLRASETELLRNPKSRSATLRRGIRTHEPVKAAA